MSKAGPQILEPMMKLDVFSPEDNIGDVIGDLNRRRGMIQGQEPAPDGVRVKAEAPLSAMFGYIGDLRTMTSGRGQFSMEFSHYAPARATSRRKSSSRPRSAKKLSASNSRPAVSTAELPTRRSGNGRRVFYVLGSPDFRNKLLPCQKHFLSNPTSHSASFRPTSASSTAWSRPPIA